MNREKAADEIAAALRQAAQDVSILRGDAGRQGPGRGDDRHRRPPARPASGRSGARGQGLLLRKAHGQYPRGRQAGAGYGKGAQAGGADGFAVAELPVPAAGCARSSAAASWARSSPSTRAGITTARAGTSPRAKTWPRSASRIRIGSAGCWAAPRGRSTPTCTSNSVSSRNSRAELRTSGIATAPAWRTSIWILSFPTTPSPTAASSPGTTCARIPTPSSAFPPSRKSRCSTRTAPRSATATAITPSSAARTERSIRRAAKAARNGGSCRRRAACGGRTWCSICMRPGRSRSW